MLSTLIVVPYGGDLSQAIPLDSPLKKKLSPVLFEISAFVAAILKKN
jgi:hypothetical protein